MGNMFVMGNIPLNAGASNAGSNTGSSGKWEKTWKPWTPSIGYDENENAEEECPICLEPFIENKATDGQGQSPKQSKKLVVCTPCIHRFHKKCIEDWLSRSPKGSQSCCPCCRRCVSKKDLTVISVLPNEKNIISPKRRSVRLGTPKIPQLPQPERVIARLQPLPMLLRAVVPPNRVPNARANAQVQPLSLTTPFAAQLRQPLAAPVRQPLVAPLRPQLAAPLRPPPDTAMTSEPRAARMNAEFQVLSPAALRQRRVPTDPNLAQGVRLNLQFQAFQQPTVVLSRARLGHAEIQPNTPPRATRIYAAPIVAQVQDHPPPLRVQPRRAARINHPYGR